MAVDKKGKQLPKGITTRKDGRYMGRFTFQGERYTLYGSDVKKLEKSMQDMRYELEHGLVGDMKKTIFDSWFHIWIDEYKTNTVKPSTLNHFKTYYRLYIKKQIGKKELKDIRPIHIQKIYNDMVNNGFKSNTIKKVDNIINNMLNYAVKNDLIIKNPCMATEIPKTDEKKRCVLSQEEQRQFMTFISNHNIWKKYVPLFTTALGTGMRIGELLGLNWGDINFKAKTIEVNRTMIYMQNNDTKQCSFSIQKPKTKTSNRVIPLMDNLIFALKKHQKEQNRLKMLMGEKWNPIDQEGFENLVFTTEFGRPIDRNSINRVLKCIVADINKDCKNGKQEFPNFSSHTLRHTFATRCFENNIPPKVVQEFLGHSTLSMTMDLYTHVLDDTKQNEISKLEKFFKEA